MFRRRRAAGDHAREIQRAIAISNAVDIGPDEFRRLDRAYTYKEGEQDKKVKYQIKTFYGLDSVTVDDVHRDKRGRFRRICRNYAYLRLYLDGRSDVVAWFDWRRSVKGKQPSEYSHLLQHTEVVASCLPPEGVWIPSRKLTYHVRTVWARHGQDLIVAPGIPSPTRAGNEIAWLQSAIVRPYGGQRFKREDGEGGSFFFDWSHVAWWSRAFRERLVKDYKRGKRLDDLKTQLLE